MSTWCGLFQCFSGLTDKSIICIFKGIYNCPIEIIKGLTDKGQFEDLIKLKGPQVGNSCIQYNFFH